MLLPKTASVSLRVVVATFAGSLVALALSIVFHAVSGFLHGELKILPLFVAATLSFCGVQLWLLKPWSRKVTKFAIGALIVLEIGGIFNPFYDMDYRAAHGGQSPDWTALAAIVGPLVVLGLWCFHVLDKFKAEFK